MCYFGVEKRKTRREHLKSALYLRLKRRKVFKIVKGWTLQTFSNLVCCKISEKLKGGHFGDINFETVSQCRNTTKGRPFGFFEIAVCRKISINLKGGPFGDKQISIKNSHSAEKIKGGTLKSRPVLYLTFKIEYTEGEPFALA